MFSDYKNPVYLQYKELSSFLGFDLLYAPKYWNEAPSIEGYFKDRRVRVFSYDEVSCAENVPIESPQTVLFVYCNNHYNYDLTVGRKGVGAKFLKKLGSLFVKNEASYLSRDKVFNDAFSIHHNDDFFAKNLLEKGFQEQLLTYVEELESDLVLEGNVIYYKENEALDDPVIRGRIEQIINLAVFLAELVEQFTRENKLRLS